MKRVPDDLKSYFKPQPAELKGDEKEIRLSLEYRPEGCPTVLTRQSKPKPIDWANFADMRDRGYEKNPGEHVRAMWEIAAEEFEDDIKRWDGDNWLVACGLEGDRYLKLEVH